MKDNPVLKEKWDTQKRLSKEANYDVHTYMENAILETKKVSEEYKIKFKYSNCKGGCIKKSEYPLSLIIFL